MSTAWKAGSTRKWREVRQLVLDRDGHTCQLRLPGCTGRASQVDHITPRAQDGSMYDTANLRASCPACNQRRNRRRPARDWTPSPW